MGYTLGAMLQKTAVSALISAAFTLFPALPAAQGAGKGPAWTGQDSLAAAEFIRAFKERPQSVDSLVAGPLNLAQERELGFGYRLQEVWVNPAGKLGFSIKVLRHRNVAVSFEVKPVINYAALAPRIASVLKGTFAPAAPGPAAGADAGSAWNPWHWNLEAAAGPLPADSVGLAEAPPAPAVRKALAYYMSPYSGTTYGIRGGRSGQLLENRDRFLSLADTLMPDKVRALYLLRSLNPASRLTAAEFVIRHKEAFPDYEKLLGTALKRVFQNPAKAETMRGDAVLKEDARRLAFEYAHIEVKRSGRGVFRQ